MGMLKVKSYPITLQINNVYWDVVIVCVVVIIIGMIYKVWRLKNEK